MTLARRTGLAALAASTVAVLVLAGVATNQFERSLDDQVDARLDTRAERAEEFVERLDQLVADDLGSTTAPVRVTIDGESTALGGAPAVESFTTFGRVDVEAGGETWRVLSVPVGDDAVVEFYEPLGDVDAIARTTRRRAIFAGTFVAIAAGLIGWLLGRRASRPLAVLRSDIEHIDGTQPDGRRVRPEYGASDVDEVARALSDALNRVGDATRRRDGALAASQAFAAMANHELRTPLQSAMTNLDITLADESEPHVAVARSELARMGSALSSVSTYAEVDRFDPAAFAQVDVAEIAEETAARYVAQVESIEVVGPESLVILGWEDGVRTALDNVVRNAVVHGCVPPARARVVISLDVDAVQVVVSDDGPGVEATDVERLARPFERGASSAAGSGLGLALAVRIAALHGGDVRIERRSPRGLNVALRFGAPQPGAPLPPPRLDSSRPQR